MIWWGAGGWAGSSSLPCDLNSLRDQGRAAEFCLFSLFPCLHSMASSKLPTHWMGNQKLVKFLSTTFLSHFIYVIEVSLVYNISCLCTVLGFSGLY